MSAILKRGTAEMRVYRKETIDAEAAHDVAYLSSGHDNGRCIYVLRVD